MENEKRLIDVNEAIEKINCLCVDGNENWIGTENQSFVDHADVINILSDMPTVDAVELPPIKIGDTAYFIINGNIYKAKVCFMRWEQHEYYGIRSNIQASVHPTASVGASFNDFGKTVFLTEEEAKAALAKMDGQRGQENDA